MFSTSRGPSLTRNPHRFGIVPVLACHQGILKMQLRVVVFPINHRSDAALGQRAVGKRQLFFGKQQDIRLFGKV